MEKDETKNGSKRKEGEKDMTLPYFSMLHKNQQSPVITPHSYCEINNENIY